MGKFHDLHAVLSASEGVYPETMLDDLMNAYNEDISVPDAKIQELSNQFSESEKANLALKAHMYDLINGGVAVGTDDVPGDETPDDESDSDEDEDNTTIDDLFGEDDDN